MEASSRAVVASAALGAACALAASIAMWGFTVDDALIPIAYARHVAEGVGYRFSPHAAPSDGVTPLPWTFLLVPLSRGDALSALARAKALGVVAWSIGGAALGAEAGREAARGVVARVAAVAATILVALVFPIGAWAASGMETGLTTALATIAACFVASRPRAAAVLAGLAASLRPELLPWSIVVAVGAALPGDPTRRRRRAALATIVAAAPFAACAAARLVAFGRPAPLAVLAKPSDPSHGAAYAVAACVVVVTPLLAFAPVSIARAGARARTLALAFVAHVVAVILAGGDWMPWARLFVPVAPSLALVFVATARVADRRLSAARLALAFALATALAWRLAPQGRTVQRDREELVLRARPALADARVVAALDVGWLSAATDADIVDLAGLTDPTIAALGGGHTSKRVDTTMLLDRGVDAVVIYAEPRVVELRLLRSDLFAARFVRSATIPFGARGASYDVYRRR